MQLPSTIKVANVDERVKAAVGGVQIIFSQLYMLTHPRRKEANESE
jgi:hypothetical protein